MRYAWCMDEFELRKRDHTQLWIGREETAAIQVGQLDVVSAVFVAELAEIVVFSGETFDERFRVGHADLLTRLLRACQAVPAPQGPVPASVGIRVILPGSSGCQGLAWRSR